MTKLVIAGKIHPDGMALLEVESDLEIELFEDPSAHLPMESLSAADALLIRYGVITSEMAAGMPNLKVMSRHGVGCDNLPNAELGARGIPVTIVGPVNAVSVAEQIMAMMMALTKKIIPSDAAVRDGKWSYRNTVALSELSGKTLLLLGFGRIGREVARRAAAFDMSVKVFDPFVDPDVVRSAGYVPVEDWKAALPEIDVLSLHLPANPDTMGLIGVEELARMKPTGILINAARGGLIDEEALFDALRARMSSGGAGLDCLASEPPAKDLRLLSLPNVVFSPHSAALSAESTRAMGVVAAQNILAGLTGELKPELIFNATALKEAAHDL
ncbi:hydroxyacid dehydrogenase [Aliiroseovarius sp. KMU-50]|uniref:Hydroxyacid dehydrogenase n=1 Tax=Aliiroseovarius salicola TaxID=3009082 RepID=A0ABT4W4N8_9RHOB|nr:hydroxyacid dehydrogenase [Aliiroseovarius sp. KMU-50]MDA5095473.1 hydroxyacid dehydrogenase [Aliiroseovarius sp. KMU-50]